MIQHNAFDLLQLCSPVALLSQTMLDIVDPDTPLSTQKVVMMHSNSSVTKKLTNLPTRMQKQVLSDEAAVTNLPINATKNAKG